MQACQAGKARAAGRIWLEDESRTIGKRVIPSSLWVQMRESKVLFLERSFDERVEHLVYGYGVLSQTELCQGVQGISRRLGPQRTELVLECIRTGDYHKASSLLLTYYDKGYLHGLNKRDAQKIHRISVHGCTPKQAAIRLRDNVKA